jgi:signal transduction histidine kinase/CheY-like chemotaxis protein
MSSRSNRSLTGKIIITLLIACVTLLLSWGITNLSFQRIKEPVRHLSEPNRQLRLVNKLLQDVVLLDQLQRVQASQEHIQAYNPFLHQSQAIMTSLDSLSLLSGTDTAQLERIDEMKAVLTERDKIFVRYMNLRRHFVDNDTLSTRIRSLSDYVSNTALRTDSNIFTTESSITATTIEEPDTMRTAVKQGFWDKLFKRKRAPERKEIRHFILEQLKTSVDTLALLHEDSIINQLSQSIAAVEIGRQQSRNALIRQRMQLDRIGNTLISQLLVTLHDMEANELRRIESNNVLATDIINNGLQKIGFVLIVFILLIVLLAMMIFTDIAKSNEYKKQLIAAKEEAEELSQVKQRFLANMSHELRTPLQAIIGFAEQMKTDERERTQKNTDIIYQSSQHLLQVVNEVLDYTRIASGRLMIESRRFRVKEVADSVQEAIGFQARQKGLSFHYEAPELQADDYIGDPFRLRQILFNLLHNAVKFTEAGAVSFAIRQEQAGKRTLFTFSISDTGIGIAAADADKIFAHFEQLETDQMQQGSGLGLSIVRALVERQGGSISLESAPGKGSLFIVQLSYLKAQAPADALVPGQDERPFEGSVWIVDDDSTILGLCSLILRKQGIVHQCFHSPAELLQQSPPTSLHTVFMDIRMPGISGFELLARLKEQWADKPAMRYIALTAQSLPDERDQILAAGFDALLNKPFLAAELLATLYAGPFPEAAVLNEVAEAQIWRSFWEETQRDLDYLKQAIDAAASAEMAEIMHRIAGRSGQMGLADLAGDARRLEWTLRKGQYDPEALSSFYQTLAGFVANAANDETEGV